MNRKFVFVEQIKAKIHSSAMEPIWVLTTMTSINRRGFERNSWRCQNICRPMTSLRASLRTHYTHSTLSVEVWILSSCLFCRSSNIEPALRHNWVCTISTAMTYPHASVSWQLVNNLDNLSVCIWLTTTATTTMRRSNKSRLVTTSTSTIESRAN